MPLLARDIMWSKPPVLSPEVTLQAAAKKMIEVNAGVLPVGRDGKVEGIITDRDIVVRAVAEGKAPERTKVADFMTPKIHSCKETDTVVAALEMMKRKKVSRLAVMNEQNKFTGIVSFGHIFRNDANAEEVADGVARVVSRTLRDKKAAVA
jgi:CBS domain-containing protein